MRSLASWDGEGTRTHSRVVVPNPGEFSPLLFMVASKRSQEGDNALFLRMHLLHYDYYTATGNPDSATLAIMLTPSGHPERIWDTTVKAAWGDQGHLPADIDQLRAFIADRAV